MAGIDHRGYLECMDEIKERISAIDFALTVPNNPVTRDNLEGLALNLRKTFELMIMACQAAHTHLIGKQVKEWRIKNIERIITKYNSDFYMHPVNATKDRIDDRYDMDVLTLAELRAAYHACSNWLHAKGPYGDKLKMEVAFQNFRTWRDKIVRLLNAHCVKIDEQTFLYCAMNAEGTGNTHVSVFIAAPKDEFTARK